MYGIPDYKLAKLDKKQFEEDWKYYTKMRLEAQRLAVENACDRQALMAMNAMYGTNFSPLNFGLPPIGCSLGGGFGLFG